MAKPKPRTKMPPPPSGEPRPVPKSRASAWARGLILGGLALRLALAWQPFAFQLERGPLVDDSFYSLNVARHLAQGHGLTFDGIHATNGIQPLYVFLMVPVFWFFSSDPVKPVYAALTLLALANTAAGYFLYRIARRKWGEAAGLFALGLFVFSPYIIESSVNGLETSLVALFWMLSLDLYLGKIRPAGGARKDRLGLSVVLAFVVFTRVDGGLLALAIALDYILRPAPGAPALSRRLTQMTEIAAAALILYSPWAIYNLVAFHSIMPMSGPAVRFLAQRFGGWGLPIAVPAFAPGTVPARFYLGHLVYSVWALYRGQLFFPASPLAFLVFQVYNLGGLDTESAWPVILLIFGAGVAFARWRERESDVLFLALGLFLLAYNFYVFGYWFFFRYFYPIQLALLLLGAGLFHFLEGKIPRRARRPALVVLIVFYALIFGWTAKQRLSFSTDDNIVTYYNVAKSLPRIASPDARVGVFQAGTIGYFADRTVINLDGVVNAEALAALREKRLLPYLRTERIEYIVDYGLIMKALLLPSLQPGEEKFLSPLTPPDSKIQVFRVLPPAPGPGP